MRKQKMIQNGILDINKKIKSLGVQGYPGDKFKINNGSSIVLDKFGLYEIESNKYFFINTIEAEKIHNFLIIDYEEGDI